VSSLSGEVEIIPTFVCEISSIILTYSCAVAGKSSNFLAPTEPSQPLKVL